MKKTLIALSLVAAVFTGCGDKISEEMAKNYENSLNDSIKTTNEALVMLSILTGSQIELKSDGYKCETKGDYLLCNNPSMSLNLKQFLSDEKLTILDINDISLETNNLYLGDKTGEISLKEALANMPKKTFQKLKINSIKFSDNFKQLAKENIDEDSKEILELISDEYQLNSNNEANNLNNDMKIFAKFELQGKNSKNSLDFTTNSKIKKEALKLYEKANILYDTQKQQVVGMENIQNNDLVFDFANIFEINDAKLNLVLNNDLRSFQKDFNANNDSINEPFKSILYEFFENKPHKLNVDFNVKAGFSILDFILKQSENPNKEEFEKGLENIQLKINEKDLTKEIIKIF